MTRAFARVVALSICLGCTHASDVRPGAAQAQAPAWPPDVAALLARIESCEHFLGEEPYDEERRVFLSLRVRQNCSGINEQVEATRALHAENQAVLERLADFEAVRILDR